MVGRDALLDAIIVDIPVFVVSAAIALLTTLGYPYGVVALQGADGRHDGRRRPRRRSVLGRTADTGAAGAPGLAFFVLVTLWV